MEVQTVLLGDIAQLGDGAHAKINRQEKGIMYLTSKNIKNKKIDTENIDYISAEDFEKYFSFSKNSIRNIQKNDILISIIGSIGNTYMCKGEKIGISSSVAIIRPNCEKVNPKYLLYAVSSSAFKNKLTNEKGGSVQGYTNLPLLRSMKISLPSVKCQGEIANILSSFDEKIEKNIVHIIALEETANVIYSNWFCNYNYPDATGEMNNGIPVDWTNSNVFDNVVEVREKNREKNNYPVLSVVKVGEFKASEDVFTKRVYSKDTSNYKIIKRNQVGYNPARANIGSIAMLTDYDAGLVSPIYIVFEMKKSITPVFFYYYMKQPMFIEGIKHHAIGTTRQNFPFEAFKMFTLIVPPMKLQKRFEEIAQPIEQKIAKLKEENAVLAEIRDTLSTKFMSGELPVEVGEA